MAMNVRQMTAADVAAVAAIEAAAQINPWPEQVFLDCLNMHYDTAVIEIAGQDIVGFIMSSTVLDEIHLFNIAVKPDCHGKGYGKQLLDYLFDRAKQVGSVSIFLEVRASNTKAINLYKKYGFTQIDIRKNYYRTPQKISNDNKPSSAKADREDALVMQKLL